MLLPAQHSRMRSSKGVASTQLANCLQRAMADYNQTADNNHA